MNCRLSPDPSGGSIRVALVAKIMQHGCPEVTPRPLHCDRWPDARPIGLWLEDEVGDLKEDQVVLCDPVDPSHHVGEGTAVVVGEADLSGEDIRGVMKKFHMNGPMLKIDEVEEANEFMIPYKISKHLCPVPGRSGES